MNVAIMQPYFFPYIGYFQLMAAVDAFVFLDDVQYVERSWINRNRIRRDGRSAWLSMPVRKGSQTDLINQRRYVLDEARDTVVHKVINAYRGAPNFDLESEFVYDLLHYPRHNVAEFNIHLLREISSRLNIRRTLVLASEIRSRTRLPGQAGIIDICKRMGGARYVNAPGGIELYDEAAFAAVGLELRFLRTHAPAAALIDGPEHLSIIDGLMWDGLMRCAAALKDYELLAPTVAHKH